MDQIWFLFLNGLPARVPALGITAVAAAKYGIICYPAMLAWLWWRWMPSDTVRRTLLVAVLAGTLSLAVNFGLNLAVPRPRPFLILPAHVLLGAPHDLSFPSDHAAFTSAIGVTLLLAGMPGWGLAGVLGAFAIGASRVIGGVHYPSDVLGGVLVGGICATVSLQVQRPLRPALDLVLRIAHSLRLA